jgi:RNA polymerase sigma factor (sigma-70 family)
VDDLMQTMFLQLLKDRPAAEVRDPRQYLFRSAWNVLHNANQRAQRERHLFTSCDVTELDQCADRSNQLWVEDDTSSRVQRAELDRTLLQLPRACQVAMLRQYRDNKSYKEIADELGVSVHAVKKYIMRSLNHFRMHLSAMDSGGVKERNRS